MSKTNKKITRILFIIFLLIGLVLSWKAFLGKESVKSVRLHSGVSFLKTASLVENAGLYKDGVLLKELRGREAESKEDARKIFGIDIPGLWYGEYEVRWVDSYYNENLRIYPSKFVYKIKIGLPEAEKLSSTSIDECIKLGPTSKGNTCLAELISKLIYKNGGEEARNALLEHSEKDLITFCTDWLGAYAGAMRSQYGLEKAFDEKFLLCKYTYIHMLIANHILNGATLQDAAEFCKNTPFKGMLASESVNQCAHGVGYSAVVESNLSLGKALSSCYDLKNYFGDFVSNCYEGVFRGTEYKSMSYPEGIAKDFVEGWKVNYLPDPYYCQGLLDEYKHACYRYTMRGSINEEIYFSSIEKKKEFMLKWRDDLCKKDNHWGCWYGLGDSSFLIYGEPPFKSGVGVREDFWPELLSVCELSRGKHSATCTERLTHMSMNKLLEFELIKPWCRFLELNSDQKCNQKTIEDFIERFETAKKYDPWVMRIEKEGKR